jgi:ABC-type molybdenum transport system ATPase subunit/photorepair protein PhrA
MVARALVSKPKMLCLDEPLASLDACCQKTLMQSLHTLAHGDEPLCVVMVDHHTDHFGHLLSSQISFERDHNSEECIVRIQDLTPTCGHVVSTR